MHLCRIASLALRLRTLLLLLTLVPCTLSAAPPEEPVWIENGDLRVGLSPGWGGGVCAFYRGTRNYVDDNDSGRLIQSAFFSAIDRDYNPTQGGAIHNQAGGTLEFKKLGPASAYSKAHMLQWNPQEGQPARSDIELEQWATLEPDHLRLRIRWTNTGPRVQGAVNQETPVIYMVPNPPAGPTSFNHFFTYSGIRPWTGDTTDLLQFDLTQRKEDPNFLPDGHNFRATEHWMAMTDETSDGLTLFDPEFTDGHGRRSHGIAPKFKMLKPYEMYGKDDPLGRNVRENTVYIFPGDWREARRKIQALYINRMAWDFASDGLAGWSADEGATLRHEADALHFTAIQAGSGLAPRQIHAVAAVTAGLTLRYRTTTAQALQVQFKHDQDLDFSAERVVRAKLTSDGAWHELSIPLAESPQWIGTITALRLVPEGDAPATDLALQSARLHARAGARWDFNAQGESEGWFPVRDGDVLTPESDGSCLVGQAHTPGPRHYRQPYFNDAPPSDGTQPRIFSASNLDLDASKYSVVRMRIQAENTTATPRLHWHTSSTHGEDRNYVRSPNVELRGDAPDGDGYQIVEARLADHPDWRDRIQQLMLAPAQGKDARFSIDWIEIVATE